MDERAAVWTPDTGWNVETPDLLSASTAAALLGVSQSTAGREVIAGEFPGLDHFSILDWAVTGPETLAFLGRHLQPST